MKKKSEQTAVSAKVEPEIAEENAAAQATETTIYIQSLMGGSIAVDEIMARVHASAPDATEIYVKPEENKAYYVGRQSRGFVVLWE